MHSHPNVPSVLVIPLFLTFQARDMVCIPIPACAHFPIAYYIPTFPSVPTVPEVPSEYPLLSC